MGLTECIVLGGLLWEGPIKLDKTVCCLMKNIDENLQGSEVGTNQSVSFSNFSQLVLCGLSCCGE